MSLLLTGELSAKILDLVRCGVSLVFNSDQQPHLTYTMKTHEKIKKTHPHNAPEGSTVDGPAEIDAPTPVKHCEDAALGKTKRCKVMLFSTPETVSSMVGSTVRIMGTCAAGWFVIQPYDSSTGVASNEPIICRIVRSE